MSKKNNGSILVLDDDFDINAFDMMGDSEFTKYSKNYVIDGFIQKPIAIKTLYNIVDSWQ
jgi:hypothetical protein